MFFQRGQSIKNEGSNGYYMELNFYINGYCTKFRDSCQIIGQRILFKGFTYKFSSQNVI